MDTIRPSAPSDAWYVQPSAIDRWFCGVFEGGGAKGIAYTGALLALRELRGWFGAVAGASVGAITATLVAAGLTPEEIAAETDSALDRVRTGPWKGIGRLKASGGYYPSDALTQWLDQLLLTRVGRATSPDPRTRVTFDGGVWSNFPMFVFEDAAFRTLYTRTPPKIDPKLIVGFLLDESQGPPATRGEDKELQFRSQRGDQVVHAREWLEPAAAADARPVPMGWRILTWTLWPFALLGRALELNGGVERGRWPEPRSRLLQNLLSALNGLSSGLYAYMFAPIIVVALALGAWQMVTFLGQEGLRVPLGWTVQSWGSKLYVVVLVLFVFSIGTLATLVAMLGVVANTILLRAARRVIYGLASTYVNGPGAPEWAALRANVVPLPIPPGVDALSFDLPPEMRHKVIKDAREATLGKVAALIAGAATPGDLAGV